LYHHQQNPVKKLLLGCAFHFCIFLAFSQTVSTSDDEFVGPFPSWINVKQYGAIGNGVADETTALQAALDAIGNMNSTSSVVYLPPGTYRITRTLTMSFKINLSVIGADPATTKIVWAGEDGGTMMRINGVAYSRFNRISWDGKSLASIAVDQSWDGSQPYFDSGNEYADDVFSDVDFGIHGGHAGNGFAETAILRCKFIRNTKAGVSLGNFNALDIWVWNSLFQDCAIGVTNTFGAGNFKVYHCNFRNSTISDIKIGNTGEFSIRDNTSTNAQAFVTTFLAGNPAIITIQGNTVIDPVSNFAIDILNQGPVSLFDNVIRSRAGATAPVVRHASAPDCDFFSIGNKYTVSNAVQTNGRNIIYDLPAVTRTSLSNLAEASLPGTPPNLNRKIFEVPPAADATTIQNIINQAAALKGTRPVIHFAHGTYKINTTLVIPAGSDMQLIGDGGGDVRPTLVRWLGTAAGPVIRITGPSKAVLRDFTVFGNDAADDIQITNADQSGSRVFMHQVNSRGNLANLLVNGLDHTTVLAYNSVFANSPGRSVQVVGGPLAAAGTPQEGRTIICAGGQSDNQLSHTVTNGGNLMIRDVWYESIRQGPYLSLSGKGTLIMEGSRAVSALDIPVPQMSITDFSGKAIFLGAAMSNYIAVKGNGAGAKILGLGCMALRDPFIVDSTSPGADIKSFNARIRDTAINGSGSFTAKDIGVPNQADITSMLASVRNVHVQVLGALPDGVTDVRFYRLWVVSANTGIELRNTGGSNAPAMDFTLFNASCQGEDVNLQWKTTGEVNVKDFDIEKSSDGTAWQIIKTIPATGAGHTETTYNYVDIGGSSGFYRIVAKNATGDKKAGSAIKASCALGGGVFGVFPNPVKTTTTITVTSGKTSSLSLKLYDAKGTLLKAVSTRINPGTNQIGISLQTLPKGNYVLNAAWETFTASVIVIKQ
jgi:hypothetical protein